MFVRMNSCEQEGMLIHVRVMVDDFVRRPGLRLLRLRWVFSRATSQRAPWYYEPYSPLTPPTLFHVLEKLV